MMKLLGASKGIAYVEFFSKEDASISLTKIQDALVIILTINASTITYTNIIIG